MEWLKIGITLFLGGVITYLFQLLFQKKSRLSIVYSPDVQLIDTIAELTPDLSVTYKGEAVSEQLTAVIFSIFNSGKKDIKLSEDDPLLELTLPEKVEWKDIKVVQMSEGVSGGIDYVSGRIVRIKWSLLRTNEFMTFLGFVDNSKQDPENNDQATVSSDLFPKGVIKKLVLSDRIPDTTIDKIEIDLRIKGHSIWADLMTVIFPLSFLLFISYMELFEDSILVSLESNSTISNSYAFEFFETDTLHILKVIDSNILAYSLTNGDTIEIGKKEFESDNLKIISVGNPEQTKQTKWYAKVWRFLIFPILLSIVITSSVECRKNIKNNRIRKRIASMLR